MLRGDQHWAVSARVGLWKSEAAVPEEVLTPAAAVQPGQRLLLQQQCQQRGTSAGHVVLSPCNI